jgi:hypothetical protein
MVIIQKSKHEYPAERPFLPPRQVQAPHSWKWDKDHNKIHDDVDDGSSHLKLSLIITVVGD